MHTDAKAPMAQCNAATLLHLPDTLLDLVIDLADLPLKELIGLRLVHKIFRHLAAARIELLTPDSDYHLPSWALEAFPNAGLRPALCSIHDTGALLELRALLHSISRPMPRLRLVEWSTDCSAAMTEELLTAPCLSHLQQLSSTHDVVIRTDDASRLLRGFKHLQSCALTVIPCSKKEGPWLPELPSSLTSFSLAQTWPEHDSGDFGHSYDFGDHDDKSRAPRFSPALHLDLRCLLACPQLQQLSIPGVVVSHGACLALLAELRRLNLWPVVWSELVTDHEWTDQEDEDDSDDDGVIGGEEWGEWEEQEEVQQVLLQQQQQQQQAPGGAALQEYGNEALRSLHALAGLTNLESLRISSGCSAASWQLLTGLRRLRDLRVGSLQLSPGHVSTSIASIDCWSLRVDDPAEPPAPEWQGHGLDSCDHWRVADILARNSISCQHFLEMTPAEVQGLNLRGWWHGDNELRQHQETYQPRLQQWRQHQAALQAQQEQVQQQEEAWARHHEGFMAQLLPNLQRCTMGDSNHALRTATLFRNHSRLEGLKVKSGEHLGRLPAQWPQQLLSSMRRLKELRLPNVAVQDVDVLLADASGCAHLETLDLCLLAPAGQQATAAGVQQLCLGPCRNSLRRFEVHCKLRRSQAVVPLPLAALVPLLQAPPPGLLAPKESWHIPVLAITWPGLQQLWAYPDSRADYTSGEVDDIDDREEKVAVQEEVLVRLRQELAVLGVQAEVQDHSVFRGVGRVLVGVEGGVKVHCTVVPGPLRAW